MNLIFKAFAATGSVLCPDGTTQDATIGCFNAPLAVIDSATSLPDLILKGASFFTMFAGSIAVIILILAGLQYATAMGDQTKTDAAKRNMQWAGIGLGVAISAYGIVEFVIQKII